MTDDPTTLASAYLDGATTTAERALVEGDAQLLAEVERLRQVRAVIGETESAPISIRERHLAGALDAWDRLPLAEKQGDATPVGAHSAGAAGGASITAPTSLRDRRAQRRPVSTRILTAAAALVVLTGAGLIMRDALDSGSNNDIITAEVGGDDSDSVEESATAEFETGPVEAAEETFDQDGEAGDDELVVATPVPVAESVQGGPEEPPANNDLEVLSSNAELSQFANAKVISRTLLAGEPATADAANEAAESDRADTATDTATDDVAPDTTLAPPVDLCDLVDEFVGFALWESSGSVNDPVAVGINNSTGEAIAYGDDTCSVVARTPLPTP